MKAKKLTLMSMFLGFSLVIFILEVQIPPILPIPGIKLGLANVITLLSLFWLGRKETFIILVLRVILSAVFAGNAVGFIYSLAGGILAFAVMSVSAGILGERLMWTVSIIGAIGHNTGQIAAACFIMKTPALIWYLPVLLISAVITGAFTGAAAQLTYRHLNKIF